MPHSRRLDLQHWIDGTSSVVGQLADHEDLMNGRFHSKDHEDFLFIFVRKILLWYGHYNYVNYFQTRGNFYTKLLGHLKRRPVWASLAVFSYFPTVIFMTIYIFVHYYHDLHLYKYNKLISPVDGSHANVSSPMDRQTSLFNYTTFVNLDQHIRHSRSILESLGAQYIDAHFTTVVIYLFYLINVLGAYFNGLYHFGFKQPLNFTLARLMLDCRREQREYSSLIRTVVTNHIGSSENYIRILIGQAEMLLKHPHKSDIAEDQLGWVKANVPINSHCRLMKKLIHLARRGHFQPLEWTDGGSFMRRLYRYYGYSIIFIMCVYLLIFFFSINAMVQNYGQVELETPSQILFAILSMSFFTSSSNSTAFFASAMMVDLTEQIKSMNLLIDRMDNCINNNTDKLQRIISQLEINFGNNKLDSIIKTYCKEMNVELMSCFLHYKLFAMQFDKRRYNIKIVLVTSTVLVFTLPLLVWLHLPYTSGGDILTIATLFVIFQMVLYNAVCFPPCYLHSKSLKHYKQLHKLMAHINESNHLVNSSSNNNQVDLIVYDKHLAWLLRKELNYPSQLLGHFSISAMGLRFTYSHLIRVHFWYGFGLLNLFCRPANDIDAFLSNFIN